MLNCIINGDTSTFSGSFKKLCGAGVSAGWWVTENQNEPCETLANGINNMSGQQGVFNMFYPVYDCVKD